MCALSIDQPIGKNRNFVGDLSVEAAAYNSIEMELMPAVEGDSTDPWGGLEDIVNNQSVRRASVMRCATDFLDRVIPLDGASHADVVNYTVETPTRYARCFAELADGRKVCFIKLRKFIGWAGSENKRSFLFRNNGLHIEIRTDLDDSGTRGVPGHVNDVILESAMTPDQNCARKFIGIDGRQVLLPA